MSFIESIFEQVRRHPKRVVFPESEDDRILRAAAEYHAAGLGTAILIGSRAAIQKRAQKLKVNLSRVGVLDPSKAGDLERFATAFVALNRKKGLELDAALNAVKQPMYFATMMLLEGNADALVAGAMTSAAGILRPLFQSVRLEPGIHAASSCCVMLLEDKTLGIDGVLYLADCSVIPNPTAEQMADTAVVSAKLARQLHGVRPRVAFLAYSTKGSTKDRLLQRIPAAVALARQKAAARGLDADFDGELQADAALIPEVAAIKASHSSVAGKANVLIFPDLNSANICVKLLQRLSPSTTYGPILNGLSKPASDLVRGCSDMAILGSAAIVALQAVEYRKLYPNATLAATDLFKY